MFNAATLRNPVINLGEVSMSDIPDWYFEEIGVSYQPGCIMTPGIYKDAFYKSPLAYVDKVRAPLQLHIGLKDQRVSIDQGKKYYHALKARGKPAEMLCFKDDGHSVDSVEGSRAAYYATKTLFDTVQSAPK
jgi:dipeptidyl aminopeptidase/acylaminoacyl peptidase